MAWFATLSLIFLVWVVGICGIWIETSHKSELQQKGVDLGKWKAIADLGKMMQRELDPQLSQYADKDLEGTIVLAPPVKYTIEYDEETGQDRIELSSKPSDRLRLSIPNQPDVNDQVAISIPKPFIIIRTLQLLLVITEMSLAVFALKLNKDESHCQNLFMEFVD